MKRYYYADKENKSQGLFSLEELKALADKGVIDRSTNVILEGETEWREWEVVEDAAGRSRLWQPPPPPQPAGLKEIQSSGKASRAPQKRVVGWCALGVAVIIGGFIVRSRVITDSEGTSPAQGAFDKAYEETLRTLDKRLGRESEMESPGLGDKLPDSFDITLRDIVRENVRNAAAFEQKYKGKRVRISGPIYEISTDGVVMRYEPPFTEAKLGDPPYTLVHFDFPSGGRNSLVALSRGQVVVVAGDYRGKQVFMGFTLENCTLGE